MRKKKRRRRREKAQELTRRCVCDTYDSQLAGLPVASSIVQFGSVFFLPFIRPAASICLRFFPDRIGIDFARRKEQAGGSLSVSKHRRVDEVRQLGYTLTVRV